MRAQLPTSNGPLSNLLSVVIDAVQSGQRSTSVIILQTRSGAASIWIVFVKLRIFRTDDQSCPKQEWMPRLACLQSPPKLGGDALAKRGLGRSVQSPAQRLLMNFREAHRLIRSASRKSIRSLRVFEQTAPPSLREGTPPNLGGDWSTSVTAKPGLHRIHYIQTFTRRHSAAPRPFCLGHVWS